MTEIIIELDGKNYKIIKGLDGGDTNQVLLNLGI